MADFHNIRLPGTLLANDPKIIVGDVTYDLSQDRISYRPRLPVFLCGGGRTTQIGTAARPTEPRGPGWAIERVATLPNGTLKPCAPSDAATPGQREGFVVWERGFAEGLVGFVASGLVAGEKQGRGKHSMVEEIKIRPGETWRNSVGKPMDRRVTAVDHDNDVVSFIVNYTHISTRSQVKICKASEFERWIIDTQATEVSGDYSK